MHTLVVKIIGFQGSRLVYCLVKYIIVRYQSIIILNFTLQFYYVHLNCFCSPTYVCVVLYLRSIETETQGAQTKTDGRQFLEIAQVKVSF